MGDTHDDPIDLSPAGEAFADYLELLEDGEAPDFEEFCGARADLADDLRRLHGRWLQFLGPGTVPGGGEDEIAPERAAALLDAIPRHGEAGPALEDRGAVARGGMGEVRAVWDRTLRRTLAMKVLLAGRGSSGSIGLARFLDEARISAQLDHPGIVPVHALGLDPDGRVYYTMPLIRGMHLGEAFEAVRAGGEGEWTRERALSVLLRVCEAVAFAHSRGVLHRDLKPANVMVGPFGETYVMDWGLAKLVGEEGGEGHRGESLTVDRRLPADASDESSLMTRAGSIVGTPAYLAPELASGGTADARSDVYSLGAMLYELLAGRKPYGGEASRSPMEILEALGAGPPPPLRSLDADVPPELEAVCERAMERDPARRYPDVMALAGDLRAFLEGRVVAAYESGAVAELRKWVARNRATAAAAAAAVLLAIAGSIGVTVSEASRRAQVEERNDRLEEARAEEARQAGIARARTEEVLRLSDLGRLDELEERAAGLWPLTPDLAEPLEAWIADAEEVVARAEATHRPTLEALREDARPYDDEARARDEEAQEGRAAREAFRQMLVERKAEVEELYAELERDGESESLLDEIARFEDSVSLIEEKLAPLEAMPFVRFTWEFATPEAQWEHDTLAGLIARIEAFAREGGLVDDVRGRRSELDRIVELSADGDAARAAWAEAIAAIGDAERTPAYGGLELGEQFGLVPIGADPESGLREFAHVQSGEIPVRDPATGELTLTEESGIVLVLIPGGKDAFGAQSKRPEWPNLDPDAFGWESPIYTFTVAPYFISKYEMTQGQWLRSRGSNPSELHSGSSVPGTDIGADTTLLHPVETVGWSESVETLRRLGLLLPTEVQWEYAARAGSDTPWYTGTEFESLQGHANIADRTLAASGQMPAGADAQEWLDDGRVFHAPVGSYAPNPFGLHDVFGNVAEWCRDDYSTHANRPREGDGLRTLPIKADRVSRGGGFLDGRRSSRAAARKSAHGPVRDVGLGLRPARAIE